MSQSASTCSYLEKTSTIATAKMITMGHITVNAELSGVNKILLCCTTAWADGRGDRNVKCTMTSPCDECPFLNTPNMKRGFTLRRLKEFAGGEFPCHQTADADNDESEYRAADKSVHCAGALIFNEKRNSPHQMMRITERFGKYDMTKLDMNANVR